MQIQELFRTDVASPDWRCSAFPGAVQLADGSILLWFVAGSDFESSDQHLEQALSRDGGRSWQWQGPVYDHARLDLPSPFTDSAKPTRIARNSLLAVGYGFVRDRPEMDLSNYAEQFGRFPECRNFVMHSADGGRNWSLPQWISHPYSGMEISGPALKLRSGEVLFFASPFGLQPDDQKGLCFSGGKNGREWREVGEFFRQSGIAAWEVRGVQLPSGRIVLVFWAYDLARQQHLNNHLVWSDDDGRHWSESFDTGMPGQAANLILDGERLLLIQTRRTKDDCGLYLSRLELCGGAVRCSATTPLMSSAELASAEGDIEAQFRSLKFGQPSLLALEDGMFLTLFWQAEKECYKVRVRGLRITD